MTLKQDFFARHAVDVAKGLLGKKLTSTIQGKASSFIITETEAYHGFDDKACHGHKGKTARNEIIFDSVGFSYVYLIYGKYWMLNATTYQTDFPSAVLIRGVYDLNNKQHFNGPGKLTKGLGITKDVNKLPLFENTSSLWIEDSQYDDLEIVETPRIGIDYAQESKDWLWRFYIDPAKL